MQDNRIKYVDFTYVDVYYGGIALDPPILEGEPAKTLTFNAVMSFALPDKYKIEWLVDGVLKKSEADLFCSLNFSDAGTYHIAVRLVDDSGKTVLEDTGTAIIKSATTTTTTTISTSSTTSTSTSITGQTTTTAVSTTTQITQTTTADSYDYAAALAAWVSDFTSETNARTYDGRFLQNYPFKWSG